MGARPWGARPYFLPLEPTGVNVGDDQLCFIVAGALNFVELNLDDVKATPEPFGAVKATLVGFGPVNVTPEDFGDAKVTGVKLGDALDG